MEYDRKSAVSSFYGGRPSNAEALHADFPPSGGQTGRLRTDSASSFYNPNGPSRASAELLTRPTAGYNSGSYFNAGREEPVKGGYDEEEAAGLRDEPFDIYADFNNAGPRYSTAFGKSDAGYAVFSIVYDPEQPSSIYIHVDIAQLIRLLRRSW